MVEPIGIASGVLALASFAFNSSSSLFQTIQSIKSSKRDVDDLGKELEALKIAIESLKELVSNDDPQFEPLRLPLLRCGKACKEFEQVIAGCSTHSHESGTSIRDWAKLQYMGRDIVGFKKMLAGYKATISIVVADVNLRTTRVTANVVQELKKELGNTVNDLEDQLESLNRTLEALNDQENRRPSHEISGDSLREEINSIRQCLALCEKASKRTEKVKTNVFKDVSAGQGAHQYVVSTLGNLIIAKRVTAALDARQVVGEMTDETVQALAKSLGVDLNRVREMTEAVNTKGGEGIRFEDQYGSGYKLAR